ncbi:MAG: hypothetical protein CL946_06025 [Ectothiorhodospiraceae bacterium]|nr:hypothetical protein [Ectothiorhodospiraceae bacterium]
MMRWNTIIAVAVLCALFGMQHAAAQCGNTRSNKRYVLTVYDDHTDSLSAALDRWYAEHKPMATATLEHSRIFEFKESHYAALLVTEEMKPRPDLPERAAPPAPITREMYAIFREHGSWIAYPELAAFTNDTYLINKVVYEMKLLKRAAEE